MKRESDAFREDFKDNLSFNKKYTDNELRIAKKMINKNYVKLQNIPKGKFIKLEEGTYMLR